jgi:hypothetical protein
MALAGWPLLLVNRDNNMPKKYRVILKASIVELIRVGEGEYKEDDTRFFIAKKEIQLPFMPRKGMRLSGLGLWGGLEAIRQEYILENPELEIDDDPEDDDGKPPPDGFLIDDAGDDFTIDVVSWNIAEEAWHVWGNSHISANHEDNAEYLEKIHPGWQFRFYQ